MSSDLALPIFLLAFSANVLLGLFVLLRDPRSATMRLFFLLITAMNIWALFNFLSARSGANLLITRLVLFFAVAFAFCFFLFAHTFPGRQIKLKPGQLKFFAVWSAVVMAVTLSPLVFKDIHTAAGSSLGEPIVGPGIGVFGLTVLFYDAGGLYLLAKKYLGASSFEKKQRFDLLVGMGSMLVTIIVLGFIFPAALKNTSFIPYASTFMLPFVIFTTYAIVRHHFLDIRLLVARSVAYMLSLGFVAFIFSLLIIGAANITTAAHFSHRSQQALNLAGTLILVLSYPWIKRFFDRLTNKFFYRDSYDTQIFLNELNRALVSSIDLELILHKSARLIEENLKPTYARFEVMEKYDKEANGRKFTAPAEALSQFKVAGHIPQSLRQRKIIIADDLPRSDSAYQSELSQRNIAIIVRLMGHTSQDTARAYLILGPKKSGNIYNKQDIRILEIVSNEMVIAMQNALRFEEIKRFNITLQEKVDDATKQLRSANHRLKELDQTKDEFISMASHQLRTPLTTIKGYLSMVLEGDVGPVTKDERKMIEMAFDGAEKMVFLIADLLNISRLQSGKFVIENKPTDLVKMVEGEVNQLQDTAAHHNLKLTLHKPEKFPMVSVDDTKIRQVVMNFLDNAIYYTPAGGSIDVVLEATDDAISYTVNDTGLGVPKAEQHHLFTKFYRAGNARKMRPDGTGLGLFMAKKVITAQGGAIIFKSTEGKGSTFGFSFPRNKVELKGQPADKPKTAAVAA
jgi:signal transduction histidine kinase